jgi:hypothetical protein
VRRVRCGKPRCRCSAGSKHVAYYHVWHQDGRRLQRFVRRRDVEHFVAACDANRSVRARLRAGRSEYKRLLASSRTLVKGDPR